MGFGESILGLTGLDNPWIAKGVAIGLVVLLLGKKYLLLGKKYLLLGKKYLQSVNLVLFRG